MKSESEVILLPLANEDASLRFGKCVASAIIKSALPLSVINLRGDLGAGKTTMSRGILQGFGHGGQVKSPTYTLVEPYELENANVYHFDLYRLGDPEELEFMGIRDYFEPPEESEKQTACLVEWPDRGVGYIPEPNLTIALAIDGLGRRAEISCHTNGLKVLIERLISELFD